MTKQTKRRFLAVASIAVAIGVAAWLLRPTPILVDAETVERGVLRVTVDEQGRTRARYRYTVAAPVTGRVLRTQLDEGNRVEQGDLLVHIAPPPENLRTVATAEAELHGALAREHEAEALLAEGQSNQRRAASEAQRRIDLYRRGLVSSEERDRYTQLAESAAARVTSAEATLAAAEAGVEMARARLLGVESEGEAEQLVSVRAPVSGRILHVLEESERVVVAGTPLFELSRGDALEVIMDLRTEDAVKVRAGNEILITGWGGDAVLTGSVRYIEPGAFTKISTLGVEEQRVYVIGDVDAMPPELGSAFRFQGAIVIWQGDNVLRVPASALFRRKDAWHVYVINEGRSAVRKVAIRRRGTEYAQVTDGLSEGEQVILFPSDLIDDGVRVTTQE